MILTGYALLLSGYLWLELCLIMSLTLDFADFKAHQMEIANFTRRALEERVKSLELENR